MHENSTNTWKRGSVWMMLISLTATMLVSSCGIVKVSSPAVCDGTQRYRGAHADAILAEGAGRVLITGAALIAAIDAACGDT